MTRIANNYLNLAKLGEDSFVLQPTYVELGREILTPLLASYGDLLANHGQVCQIKTDRPDMLVWADKELFVSVWENLLNNAIKYGNPGGKIVFGLLERGAEYEFNVWNSGPGVPLDQVERIFDRFISGTSLTVSNGTGIGLYLARKIVEVHGGRLWVETQPGAWANFVFTLPRRETVVRAA
jgi:signal transduction histidine kinase